MDLVVSATNYSGTLAAGTSTLENVSDKGTHIKYSNLVCLPTAQIITAGGRVNRFSAHDAKIIIRQGLMRYYLTKTTEDQGRNVRKFYVWLSSAYPDKTSSSLSANLA